MQGKNHFTPKLFYSVSLLDLVSEGNFYRRLDKAIDLRFLYGKTRKLYSHEGTPSIDPVVFAKLILIGYFENITSTRKIIEIASLRNDFRLFIGYDLDKPLPHHSTISRTRKLWGEDLFLEIFKYTLGLCNKAGMISGDTQIVDSVLVKANASMDSLEMKRIVNDGIIYLEKLNKEEEGSDEEQKVNDQENGKSSNGVEAENEPKLSEKEEIDLEKGKTIIEIKEEGEYNKIKKTPANWDKNGSKTILQSQYDKIQKERESRAKRRNGDPNVIMSNETHYSTTDFDARISRKPGKGRLLHHLGQICVDKFNHVITGINADFSDKNDAACLPALMDQVISNLNLFGFEVKEVLADGGYPSSISLNYLEEKQIQYFMPPPPGFKPDRIAEGFRYDELNDQYICKNGKSLLFKSTAIQRNGTKSKVYKSNKSDCSQCPFKSECIKGKETYKKLTDARDKHLYQSLHNRMQSPQGKKKMKIRQSRVEPVIGTLVNFMGMRRSPFRGNLMTKIFMIGAATAYNLKKFINHVSKPSKIALQQPILVEKSTYNRILASIDDGILLSRWRREFLYVINMNWAVLKF
jgi:transposase